MAVLWARSRWFYVVSAVSLHVATWLLLGLDYWAWAGTVLVLFVDWPEVVERVQAWRMSRPATTQPVRGEAVP